MASSDFVPPRDKLETASEVAADHSFSGTTTGQKCGESVTTNENAERLGASTDHDGEGAERGREHDAELARIVAAWDELPAVLKGAMLAIVDSAGAARLGRDAESEARNSG